VMSTNVPVASRSGMLPRSVLRRPVRLHGAMQVAARRGAIPLLIGRRSAQRSQWQRQSMRILFTQRGGCGLAP
jgi:hypothetical protein